MLHFGQFHFRRAYATYRTARGLPGIAGGIAFRPETAKPMGELAEVLLRGPSTLTRGEREIIATLVSGKNDCYFCHNSHRAIAAHQVEGSYSVVDAACVDASTAPVSDKLKALLAIAGKVQEGGKKVTSVEIARAREAGATDLEIHDTVLIAAAFCMFNRYVDRPRQLDSTGRADVRRDRQADLGQRLQGRAAPKRSPGRRLSLDLRDGAG